MKGSLFVSDPWDFTPYLMRCGGAACVVATWRVLIGGFFFFSMTIGFPAAFQFFGL